MIWFGRRKDADGLELVGLDAVAWASLKHAYGSARDLPAQLRALASRDPQQGEKAIHAFYGNIWHQGTTYSATSRAVPFLRQILGDVQNPQRAEILELLVHLAFGHSYHDAHQASIFFEAEREKAEFQAKIKRELNDVERARQAVREGVTQYLALFDDPTPKVRSNAVYLASLFSREESKVAPALWKQLENEGNPMVRATCWKGLAFSSLQADEVRKIEIAFQQNQNSLEKWALATVLLRHGEDAAGELAAQIMIESLDAPENLAQLYGELPFCSEGIAADSAAQLLQLGFKARKFYAPLCAKLRAVQNQFGALFLLESLAPLFFDSYSAQNPVEWEAIEESQREVLRALAQTDGIWGDGKSVLVNLPNLLRDFGLPTERAAMQILVGE